MPSTELTRSYEILAAPAAVLAHLAEPESYIGLSPLLVDVRDIRREDGVTHYVAVERFRFLGLIQHDNVIRVSLRTENAQLPDAAAVSGEVISPGGVRMDYRFAITSHGDAGSLVVDTLRLHTPLGLLRYAASQAGSVQANRGRVLAQRLNGEDVES
ncbi:SRPBCC family protein [Streptacidiphilus pinicola]|uniref:SRPBCC family protein n=1 Tax=Streptacidiphilus pinicola TaxID=2219663 RepID=A0A2X0I6X2_9ACTN|nr:SRPBCC family protein [Streptacidiphilus pinicola]RAG80704.1 SRPBCC family protein [Streptacidiphilus pinicola]